MTTENTYALELPEPETFKKQIQAINIFQKIVHETLIDGVDYGTIPGTDKPTLLKPGAEKITKLLGLADTYLIIDRQEKWENNGFFRYLIKCQLIHLGTGKLVSEGIGECNSMESKYRWRWMSERDIEPGVDKTKLVWKEFTNKKTGGKWKSYRFDNEDVFTQVNTILKMAKKRALVDAALSAGRLSQVFTQDVEDLAENGKIGETDTPAAPTTEHWCKEHNTKFYKSEKMTGYAHPVKNAEGVLVAWHNEEETTKKVEKKETAKKAESPQQPPVNIQDSMLD